MATPEDLNSRDEASVMTNIADKIACEVTTRVGSHRGVVFDRVFPSYRVSCHPNGTFGISSPSVNVFFHSRSVAEQEDKRVMVREIRSSDGREVLSERVLILTEAEDVLRIVRSPCQSVSAIARVVELSEAEKAEIDNKQAKLAANAAVLLKAAGRRLKGADAKRLVNGSVRPFDLE